MIATGVLLITIGLWLVVFPSHMLIYETFVKSVFTRSKYTPERDSGGKWRIRAIAIGAIVMGTFLLFQ